MDNCLEYLELISAYMDGELSETDRARLEEHLLDCENCSSTLETYRAISLDMQDSLVPAPEELGMNVMEKIRSEGFAQSSTPAPKQKPINLILRRYVPIAACLVIVLFAASRLFGSGGPLIMSETGAMNQSARSGGGMGMDTSGSASGAMTGGAMPQAPAPGGGVPGDGGSGAFDESTYSEDTDIVSGEESQTATGSFDTPEETNEVVPAQPSINPNSNTATSTGGSDSERGGSTDYPEPPAESAIPGDMGSSTTESMSEDSMGAAPDSFVDSYFDGLYAVIMIRGTLPEAMRSQEPTSESSDGELYFEISRAEAEALIDEISGHIGVLINYHDSNGEHAQVYYTP